MKTIKLRRLNPNSLKFPEDIFWKYSDSKKWYVDSIQNILDYRDRDAKVWNRTIKEENGLYAQAEKNKAVRFIGKILSLIFWVVVIYFAFNYFNNDDTVWDQDKTGGIIKDLNETYEFIAHLVKSLF